jgi:hypothetical protein
VGTTGTCKPPALAGEKCGFLDNDGGIPSQIPCVNSQPCLMGADGGELTCRLDPVGRGADCSNPLSSCYNVLSCTNGKCEAPDYAACKSADAGDAGDQ